MTFEIHKITNKILHLSFNKQISLTSTFLRFQEHYESPKFKNKVFTLKDYRKWYKKKTGKFTYYWDWEGYNLPSPVLEPFYRGDFNPLSKNEKKLLKTFEHLRDTKFCIVGTHDENDYSVLQHEIAHGLWFTEPKYQIKAMEALKGLSKKNNKALERMLKDAGYHPEVWDDEKHAYIFANDGYLEHSFGIAGDDIHDVKNKLTYLFNLYIYIQKRKKMVS